MVSGEKRNNEEVARIEKVSVIVLDIEGTTTSISFVKETLFPFARENLESHLDAHWSDDELKDDVKLLKEQAKKDGEDKVDGLVEIAEGEEEKQSLKKNVLWQMDNDRKTTALKQLQGHIWREGYKNGKLKGHVYGDVAPALRKWSEDGRKLCVYSSGSVEAQKLLFGNSVDGDLLSLFSNHFDTELGAKGETESYAKIAKALEAPCEEILFLTDVVKEAEAAKAAGLQAMLVVREGNAPLTEEDKKEFAVVASFEELVFETSAKKKKMEESPETGETPASETSDNVTGEQKTNHVNGTGESEKMEVEVTEKETETTAETAKQKTEEEDIEVDVLTEEKQPEKEEVEVAAEAEEKPMETENIAVDEENSKNESLEKKTEKEVVEKAEPIVEQTEKPVEKTDEPKEDSTQKSEKPTVEKVEEPVLEKTEEPELKKSEETVVEKTEEPVVEKIEEPVEEKVEVVKKPEEADKVEIAKPEEVKKVESVNGKAEEVVTNGEGEEEKKKTEDMNGKGTNGVEDKVAEIEETITLKKVMDEEVEAVEAAPEVEA